MSRSFKKNPICGWTTCESEKDDKRFANRRIRRVNKILLEKYQSEDELKDRKLLYDVWSLGKDGKQVFNPIEFPELMRK